MLDNRQMALPREIEGRWQTGVVLKRDVLSTVERGRFLTDGSAVEAVLRRIDQVPWWSFVLARHLFGREHRALAAAGALGVAPPGAFSSPSLAASVGEGVVAASPEPGVVLVAVVEVEVVWTEARYVKKMKGDAPGRVSVARGRTMMVTVDQARLDRLFERAPPVL